MSKIRNLLVKLAAEGDLGEDHVAPYLADHPTLPSSFGDGHFFEHYQKVLKLNDPFKILGFLYSIEVGSLEFVKVLVERGLVKEGGLFAKIHLKVEEKHRNLAISIREMVMPETFRNKYRAGFVGGCELHDAMYKKIANS
ncbi:MAG: hypothetical protein H6779_03610 [Candidatus Nomurabacteria bacterium]|nr:hypothetical protein [Candidatus Nomurabacteria bacterium]USN87474.1 MAG: hypothetical protein H6779_03610 [Candidatus Nomurabacteria bacterium]